MTPVRRRQQRQRYSLMVSGWLSYLHGPVERRQKVVRVLQQRDDENALAVAACRRGFLRRVEAVQSLCEKCSLMREVVTPTGSRFLLCQLSRTDPAFP